MKYFCLPQEGSFYKANLHTHTTVSDGTLSPEEVKALYQKYGYSIVAYTDHEVFVPHNDLTDPSFLALNGFEAAITDHKPSAFGTVKTAHICFIAKSAETLLPLQRKKEFLPQPDGTQRKQYSVNLEGKEPDYPLIYTGECISEYTKMVKGKGFYATYNHPDWSCEDYTNYMGYDNMDAMEILNGCSRVEGYGDYNPRVYDDMLRGGKRLFCVGADDNHNCAPEHSRLFDSNRAFTVIKARELSYPAVTEALEQGHFYASEAPEIHSLYVENGTVFVSCSQADRINLTYGARGAQTKVAQNGIPVTEAQFPLPKTYGYFRITVVDERGRVACSNAYFQENFAD